MQNPGGHQGGCWCLELTDALRKHKNQDIQNGKKSAAAAGKKIKKHPLIGGAISREDMSTPNAPPKQKKAGNPLKKEL